MTNYILETDYYYSSWVWLKRFGMFFLALTLLFLWDVSDMPPYGQFAIYVVFILLSTALFLSPIDDIAVDKNYFYHIRTSYLPIFSRTERFKISSLKSIRCVGVHVPGVTMREIVTRRYQGGYTNTIELIFTDGSYKSLEVGVYKNDLIEILSKVQELMLSRESQ